MKPLIILLLLVVSSTSTFAQKAKATIQKREQSGIAGVNYTCPMHHEIVSKAQGACAKCGKQLVVIDRRSSKQGHIVYTCSMHPDFVSLEPGDCPKCGMELGAHKDNTDLYKRK